MSGYTNTREKLFLAKLHLEQWLSYKQKPVELVGLHARAHKDAVIYQLTNCYKVFLLETAAQLRVDLLGECSAQALQANLREQERDLGDLNQLIALEKDVNSWLSLCFKLESESRRIDRERAKPASSASGMQILATSEAAGYDFASWLMLLEALIDQFTESLTEW